VRSAPSFGGSSRSFRATPSVRPAAPPPIMRSSPSVSAGHSRGGFRAAAPSVRPAAPSGANRRIGR
jgi:hypothetical protein